MGFFSRLFGQDANNSSDLARERLQIVLIQDRIKLPPPMMNNLRNELIAVLSKYVDVDPSGIDISLSKQARQNRLVADVPITGAKSKAQ